MKEKNIDILDYEHKAINLSEQGKTSMYFANDKEVLGLIGVQDIEKIDSKDAIKNLRDMGYKIIMLTGDNEKTAEAIRKNLGIDEKYAELLPQNKEKVVRKLQNEGNNITMVGDGINDAPALARADIGIAIGSGTDIAIDSADVILIKNSLLDIVNSIKLSKATIKIIKENLFWAFFYNLILIPLAAGLMYPINGLTLNPMFAAFAMSISSVFVCLNSLRLRNFKAENKKQEKVNIEIKSEENMSELNKMIVKVDGMSCENCAKHVRKALEPLDGIDDVEVNLSNKEAVVKYFGSINEKDVKSAIYDAGYEYKGIEYK